MLSPFNSLSYIIFKRYVVEGIHAHRTIVKMSPYLLLYYVLCVWYNVKIRSTWKSKLFSYLLLMLERGFTFGDNGCFDVTSED